MDGQNWRGQKWITFGFHLHSWKIILSCYVTMILQIKDSWSAN